MADLSPDLSVYRNVAPQGGIGSMDLGGLLGMAQRARELQTQSSVAGALRANPNDPNAALQKVLSDPSAYPGPETITAFTQAQKAQSELKQWQMDQAAEAMGSLFTKADATLDDWHPLELMLARYGVPQDILDLVRNSAKGPNGILDHDKLVMLRNWIAQNGGYATRTVHGPVSDTEVPAGQAAYNQPLPPQATRPPPPPTQPPPGPGATAPQRPDLSQEATQETSKRYAGAYGYGGGAISAPNPQTQARLDAGVKQFTEAQSHDYQTEVTPMEKVIGLLKKNPNLSGRGMDEFNNIKNFAHSIGLLKDEDMDKVSDFETMKKYMANVPNSNSLGGTDARLWQSIAGSPSPDKLGQTNLNVMRVMLGLRRMQQAALNEFGRSGLPAGTFQDWFNVWAQKQDPMAYVWNTMSEQEQRKYGAEHFKNDAPTQRKFESSYDIAKRQGMD